MRAAVALALLLALAGCIRAPQPTSAFQAHGAHPIVFQGYDYAGATAHPSTGTFTVDTNADTDQGRVTASFESDGKQYAVDFAHFAEAPGKAFQQGGVRADFPEHGTTGNGDALLPTIHALSAGWGTGTVTVDGQPFSDPTTGNATFTMHYMVTDTGPRDPATNRITKADGATPYDPASPGDARVLNGTKEFLLNVQSTGPPSPANTLQDVGDNVTDAMYSKTWSFDVNATTGHVLAIVSVTNPQPQVPPVGQLTFTLKDAGGKAATYQYDPVTSQGQAGHGTLDLPAPTTAGKATLTVAGPGVGLQYSAHVVVTYPQSVFLHVEYSDVTVG
jgi:hypothetical protein